MGNRKWYSINFTILPAKLSYFFYMARSAYLPFMLIYLKELGLDTRKASLVNGLHLLGNVVGGPAITYIADKFNVHRKVVRIISVFSFIVMASVPFVSVAIPKASSNHCSKEKNIIIYRNATHAVKNNLTVLDALQKNNTFDEDKLFYSILFLFLLASFFGDGLIGFIESATVEKCAIEPKSNYSHQRMFGTFGMPFGVFLSGLFIDYFPITQVTCYSGLFISNAFNMILLITSCEFLIRNVTFGKKNDTSKTTKSKTWIAVKKTLRQPKHILFIATVTFQGMMQGVYMNFTFLYLKELNASNSYLTLYTALSSGASGLTFFLSKYTIDRVKNIWIILLITGASYAIRYLPFYLTTNLWVLFFSGLFQSVHAAFSVTKIRYVKEECPKEVATTFYGITSSCYRAFGYVTINIFGGMFYNVYGGKALFLYASLLAVVWSIVLLTYILFTKCSCSETSSLKSEESIG